MKRDKAPSFVYILYDKDGNVKEVVTGSENEDDIWEKKESPEETVVTYYDARKAGSM